MWDFCEPAGSRREGVARVGACPRGECADSVLPWKSWGSAAARGLLLGSLGCNPAHLLLSSAGSHCRDRAGQGLPVAGWGIPVWRYWLCWSCLGCLWVLCPSSMPQLPPQGIPGGALLHLGPGSHLNIPGLSSEAYSGLAARKIKSGLKLWVSHASDRSLWVLRRMLGSHSSENGLPPYAVTPVLNRLLVTFYTKPPHLGAKCLLRSNFSQWDFSMCSSTLLIWCPSH